MQQSSEILELLKVTIDTDQETKDIKKLLGMEQTEPLPKDIHYFYPMLQTVLNTKLKFEGMDQTVLVTQEWPNFNQQVWQEIITFTLKSRYPMSTKPHAPGEREGRREIKPQVRLPDVPDPINPGYVIDILSQRYENIVVLTCWSLSQTEATARAIWLENTIQEFLWYFGRNGIPRVYFIEELEDLERESTPGGKHFGRPLVFYVESTKYQISRQKALEQVILAIKQ